MIPYPFLYVDEKLLKHDIKEATKIYEQIYKLQIRIINKYNIIFNCSRNSKDCSGVCIKAQKRLEILKQKADVLYNKKDKIIEKWDMRPDFISKMIDTIEIVIIANKHYTVGFYHPETGETIFGKFV